MAEFASGAVNSLLGIIGNEMQLLGGVENDVQFIKEEMESMNSFLQHLARTTPPGGQHDDQVRTWMMQVRDLAYACSNCIDMYLQRGDLAVVRRARGTLGCLWRVIPWYLQKLYAQHRAATQLRELKNRARDVGERRLRYGVEIPTSKKETTTTIQAPTPGATVPSQAQPADGGDEGIIPGDDERTPEEVKGLEAMRNVAFSEARILERCTEDLVRLLRDTKDYKARWLRGTVDPFPAIAIAAPDEENGADVASEAWAHPLLAACNFDHKFWITPERRPSSITPKPLDIVRQIQQDILPGERQDHQLQYKLNKKIKDITDTENIKKHLLVVAGKRSCTVVPLEPLNILHDILESLQKGESAKDPVDATDKSGKGHQMDKRIITETAKKLKAHLESGTEKSLVGLDHYEYEDILRKQLLLPNPKEDTPVMKKMKGDILRELKPQEDKSVKEATDDKLREDQVAENIKEATQKIIVSVLRELLPKPKEDNSEEGKDELDEAQMLDEKINEITWKIRLTLGDIKEQLLIKEAVEKIKGHLKDKTTLIVLDGHDYAQTWGMTKKALNMLDCATGSAVVVITKKQTEEFCNPKRPPILYSLVGLYYNRVLRITSQREKQEQDYNVDIYRDILKKCEPHEFCMKIFTRALYFNPNRSKQELEKLRDTLVFRGESGYTNARKMLEFSYGDLPREYKTRLLYLAIFPRSHKIRRSSLVGRWVAEGLVTKEDWPSSVRQAERCFDALIDRWFIYPGDTGAAGKVKSCIVHNIVHDFITNVAREEHPVEARLSHHHAHHFSVLSDLRIRRSVNIEKFLRELHESPKLPLVNVLDLEGCELKMKQRYLKNICNKMLLLKYLSLRNIHVTKLPREINNLHQLEVLDIRQTRVDASTTKGLVLLKLKRLLASCNIDPTSTDNINRFNAVKLPRGIDKMTNMEVLSHVEASEGLKDIGKLWQLRKLGVVIHNKEAHVKKLVTVIGDLSKSLQSLSISINPLQESSHGTPSNEDKIGSIYPHNLLESLSIRGKTSWRLLSFLVKHCDQLAKVTLRNTSLTQDNMRNLGELPKLRCVRLQHESYTESNLTFKKEVFQNLKFLIVEGCNMITDIIFEDEAAPKLEKIDLSAANMNNISFGHGAATRLEKIVLSYINITSIKFGCEAAPKLEEITLSASNITSITFDNRDTPNLKKIVSSSSNMEFLSRINKLPRLKEVELNGSGITSASLRSLFTHANRITKVILRGTLLKQGDLQILTMQPNMRCLVLQEKSCDEKQLTFKKDEFPKLNLLIVECPDITNINFDYGAAPKLKKIVWSFTEMESLSGIDKLPELKELEFKGVLVPYQVRQDINARQKWKVLVFKHNKPEKAKESEADDTRSFPFFSKKKD